MHPRRTPAPPLVPLHNIMPQATAPGYAVAATEMCAWLRHAPECNWRDTDCIHFSLLAAAAARNTSVDALKREAFAPCLADLQLGHFSARHDAAMPNLMASAYASDCAAAASCDGSSIPPPAVVHRGGGKPTFQPVEGDGPSASLWLALIIRLQSTYLRHWMAWHLLQGVSHVLVYDNHAAFEREGSEALAAAVEPFVRSGLATLVPWPGIRRQNAAYEHATAAARK